MSRFNPFSMYSKDGKSSAFETQMSFVLWFFHEPIQATEARVHDVIKKKQTKFFQKNKKELKKKT